MFSLRTSDSEVLRDEFCDWKRSLNPELGSLVEESSHFEFREVFCLVLNGHSFEEIFRQSLESFQESKFFQCSIINRSNIAIKKFSSNFKIHGYVACETKKLKKLKVIKIIWTETLNSKSFQSQIALVRIITTKTLNQLFRLTQI